MSESLTSRIVHVTAWPARERPWQNQKFDWWFVGSSGTKLASLSAGVGVVYHLFFFGYYVFRWIRVYFSFWSFRLKPSNQDHVRIHDWVEVAVQRFPSNDIKGHSHSPAYWRPAATSPGLVRLSLTHTLRAARWKLTFLGQVDSPYFLMTLCTMVMWPQPRFCSLGTSRHSWRSGWLRQNVCY